MNYKFFIIVIINTCILERSTLESYAFHEKDKHASNLSIILNSRGKEMKNEKKILKRQTLLQMISNTTSMASITNLKSNIFDKMLSEEILSIKQHLYQKDSSHTPSVQITVHSNVATPTLEVNQKWPIANLFFKSINADNKNNLAKEKGGRNNLQNFSSHDITNKSFCVDQSCEEICNSQIKDKVLGLRSLPRNTAVKMCGCMKTNPGSTCSQQCTGINIARENNICAHTPSGLEMHQVCTRATKTKSTFASYSVYPVYVTYPYFWEISTYTVNPYHHPNPISKIKISKTKRHKNKKPHAYVEDNHREEILQGYNEIYPDENPTEVFYDEKLNKVSKHKTTKLPNRVNKYDEYDENTQNALSLVNRDLLVNNIVEDLKKDYSDVGIKECYCSVSSSFDLTMSLIVSLISISVFV